MTRWLITVQQSGPRYDFVMKERVAHIRRSFVAAGFTVISVPSLYYNPHNQRFFHVSHLKDSAMTFFMLKYNFSQLITVEPA